MRAIHVAPSIADEETSLQVDPVRRGRAQKHARFWFPAIAWVAVRAAGVKTNFDPVEAGKIGPQPGVHGVNRFPQLRSASHVGLVSDNDEKKAGLLELRATFRRVRIKLKLAELRGRGGKPVFHHGVIKDAVAIEEYRAVFYFVLSHFVCAVFSA